MHRNGHVIGSDKVEIEVRHLKMPLVNQSACSIMAPNGQQVLFIAGGMSPLEAGALQIAAAMMAHGNYLGNNGSSAGIAVDVARDVLAECERRELALQAAIAKDEAQGK